MTNCVIVEDNELTVVSLKKCMDREGDLHLAGTFTNATDALRFLNDHPVDLLFLDMEMEGMSGMDLIKNLIDCPKVIIITFTPSYAAEAFNFDVVDYIRKPLTYDRFQKAMAKYYKLQEGTTENGKEYYYAKDRNKMVQIFYKDVLYIEALEDYVKIHTKDKNYTILSTMKSVEDQFPRKDFMRIHRSYIVRLDKIKEIVDNCANINEVLIPISRAHMDEFMKRIRQIGSMATLMPFACCRLKATARQYLPISLR
jgi:DNA-binding LytR/AlgR family response regulator